MTKVAHRFESPLALGAALAWVVLVGLGCGPTPRSADRACAPSDSFEVSFLAVGDFGQPPGWIPWLDPRQAVAEAIDDAHRCQPADALWLLGDNFYPAGLSASNFEARVRDTVVEPFCRFLSTREGTSGTTIVEHDDWIASACSLSASERHPTPIVAVMGNHDYEPPVDGSLEKQRLPERIPEWRMPAGVAEVFEMPGLVSVIALDSVRLHEGASFEEVDRALASARGRWRIVIAHHPLTVKGRLWEERYTRELLAAIRRSGRPVHLLLAGHEHHLAASRTGHAELPLQVVAGSGARVRDAAHELLGESERWLELGFVRVEVTGDERLRVVLRAVPRFPRSLWGAVGGVSEWLVSLDGTLEERLATAQSAGMEEAQRAARRMAFSEKR